MSSNSWPPVAFESKNEYKRKCESLLKNKSAMPEISVEAEHVIIRKMNAGDHEATMFMIDKYGPQFRKAFFKNKRRNRDADDDIMQSITLGILISGHTFNFETMDRLIQSAPFNIMKELATHEQNEMMIHVSQKQRERFNSCVHGSASVQEASSNCGDFGLSKEEFWAIFQAQQTVTFNRFEDGYVEVEEQRLSEESENSLELEIMIQSFLNILPPIQLRFTQLHYGFMDYSEEAGVVTDGTDTDDEGMHYIDGVIGIRTKTSARNTVVGKVGYDLQHISSEEGWGIKATKKIKSEMIETGRLFFGIPKGGYDISRSELAASQFMSDLMAFEAEEIDEAA